MIAAETTTMITPKLKRGSTGWIFAIAANIAFALRRIIPNSYVYIGRGKEIHQRFSLHGVWLNGIYKLSYGMRLLNASISGLFTDL